MTNNMEADTHMLPHLQLGLFRCGVGGAWVHTNIMHALSTWQASYIPRADRCLSVNMTVI